MVTPANINPIFKSSRWTLSGSGSASICRVGAPFGIEVVSTVCFSPRWLAPHLSRLRHRTQANPNPSIPAQTPGPESKANPPKTPATRGRLAHQNAQASKTKVKAGIKLPAWRESETRPGSSARKKARIKAGIALRRRRNKNGTKISALPVNAGMKRARKFDVPKRKNNALVGRI